MMKALNNASLSIRVADIPMLFTPPSLRSEHLHWQQLCQGQSLRGAELRSAGLHEAFMLSCGHPKAKLCLAPASTGNGMTAMSKT